MKKLFTLAVAAFFFGLAGCSDQSEYDDSSLRNDLNALRERVIALEALCSQLNNNVSSLQTIVAAVQENDYIIRVTPIEEGGKVIGYTIVFAKNGAITIYHGADGKDGADGEDGKDGQNGKDGSTPQIGVRQDSDGVYYWTLNGEWITDEQGNKIKAEGSDGKDGQNGQDGEDGKDGEDAITPLLKIEDEYWYISYDNGASWTKLDKATGEDGINSCEYFQAITETDDEIIFVLADGTTISVLKEKEFDLQLNVDELRYSLGHTYTIHFTITGATTETRLELIGSNNLQPLVESYALDNGTAAGTISVEMPSSIIEHATIAVLASDGRSKTVMKAIHFYYEGADDLDEGVLIITSAQALAFPQAGGVLEVPLQTNLNYYVDIPAEYTWLTISPTRAALREETLTFTAQDNDGATRHAFVYLCDLADNAILQTLCFTQSADDALLGEEVLFADDTFKSYMISNFDTNQDGILSIGEAQTVQSVSISTSVKDLTGLEHCTNLRSLVCTKNPNLTSLNTSTLSNLEILDITESAIATIDLSHNPALKVFYANKTSLTALNFSQNSALEIVYLNEIRTLTNRTLELKNHPNLHTFECQGYYAYGIRPLTVLDVSGCPKLQILKCTANNLQQLDISHCTELLELSCGQNNLTELYLPRQTKLRKLDCNSNNITQLNLSACMDLSSFSANNNPFTELNLGSNPLLTDLNISPSWSQLTTLTIKGSKLTSLTLSGSRDYLTAFTLETPGLITFSLNGGYNGTSLEFSSTPKLQSLTISCDTPQLSEVDVTKNHDLKSAILTMNGAFVQEIDFSQNSELEQVKFYNAAHLTTADFSHNLKLTSAFFDRTPSLTYLDFGQNTLYKHINPFDSSGRFGPGAAISTGLQIVAPLAESLVVQSFYGNALDLTQCPNLRSLTISGFDYGSNHNRLTKGLNLLQLTQLEHLSISYMPGITELDLTSCKSLVTLECSYDSALNSLDITPCNNLTSLKCERCSLSTLDVSRNLLLTTLDCSPMEGDGLHTLYVAADQIIEYVTVNRNVNYIPDDTQIVVRE